MDVKLQGTIALLRSALTGENEHKSFATSVPHEHIFPPTVISVPSTTFVSFLSILRHLISFLQFLLSYFVVFLGIGNGSRLVSL